MHTIYTIHIIYTTHTIWPRPILGLGRLNKVLMSSLLGYLETVPAATLARLYADTRTTIAIYRMLNRVSQYTVRRLLLVQGATPFTALRAWHRDEFKSTQNAALLQLKKLHILQGKAGEVWLGEEFRQSLLRAFSGDLEVEYPMAEARRAVGFAEERWESLLYALVTGGDEVKLGGTNLSDVLIGAGLVSPNGQLAITSAGFQFLLADRSTQLWTLLVQFFTMVEASGADIVAPVSVVCRAALLANGAAVDPSGLPADLQALLVELGIVRREGRNALYATELAEQLMPDVGRTPTEAGHIIIETNYKVYAYTASPLQIAILGLFVQLKDRLANMAHGQLTGPSVGAALSKGITAEQIIAYLKAHIHPVARRANHGLPPVVEDQIHLWQRDRERLRSGEGYLYGQFPNDGLFKRTVAEATRLHAVLYVNYGKMLLVVKGEAHPAIKAFIKSDSQ